MNEDTIAVLDANVLYSFYMRDFLMRLSKQAKLYRARWSDEINEEWTRNLLKNKPHLTSKSIEGTVKWMNSTIRDALVDPSPFLSSAMELGLPDSDDAHVVAAAMASQAQFIVTMNLKDFPEPIISPLGIEAIHPDEFVLILIQHFPEEVLAVIVNMSEDYESPPLKPKGILEALSNAGLSKSSAAQMKLLAT